MKHFLVLSLLILLGYSCTKTTTTTQSADMVRFQSSITKNVKHYFVSLSDKYATKLYINKGYISASIDTSFMIPSNNVDSVFHVNIATAGVIIGTDTAHCTLTIRSKTWKFSSYHGSIDTLINYGKK